MTVVVEMLRERLGSVVEERSLLPGQWEERSVFLASCKVVREHLSMYCVERRIVLLYYRYVD